MIYQKDSLELMRGLEDSSVDSIVTDPPYGIKFMAKKWDYNIPSVEVWEEALRVLKPGGHMLCACGTRTQHRMVVNIEDAGFEIRDVVSWIYGSGFPKSMNISKAIDKAAGAEREVKGMATNGAGNKPNGNSFDDDNYEWKRNHAITAPATPEAKQWDGWGTALKPACEFFTLCRKPLSEKTVAANVLKWGTGGINVDSCRVPGQPAETRYDPSIHSHEGYRMNETGAECAKRSKNTQGRWPANLIHDGSQQVMDLFPESSTTGKRKHPERTQQSKMNTPFTRGNEAPEYIDSGSAARFFYCAKASKKDRDEGLDCPEQLCGMMEDDNYPIKTGSGNPRQTKRKNTHPTVKPTDLMRYLCRLITPPGGIVLDPYMGSGSTGKAAILEGFQFIGGDDDAESYEIAKARIEHALVLARE